MATVTFTWDAPTQYADGSLLPASDIVNYNHEAKIDSGTVMAGTSPSNLAIYSVNNGSTIEFRVKANTTNGESSAFTPWVSVLVSNPVPGIPTNVVGTIS